MNSFPEWQCAQPVFEVLYMFSNIHKKFISKWMLPRETEKGPLKICVEMFYFFFDLAVVLKSSVELLLMWTLAEPKVHE
jgi:hypothetical protein